MVSIIVSISFLSMEGSNVAYFYRKRSVLLHEEVIAGLKATIVFAPNSHGHGYLFILECLKLMDGIALNPSDSVFTMLINIKLTGIDGIFTFDSRINFILL